MRLLVTTAVAVAAIGMSAPSAAETVGATLGVSATVTRPPPLCRAGQVQLQQNTLQVTASADCLWGRPHTATLRQIDAAGRPTDAGTIYGVRIAYRDSTGALKETTVSLEFVATDTGFVASLPAALDTYPDSLYLPAAQPLTVVVAY